MEPWLASTITHYEPMVKSIGVELFLVAELIFAGASVMAMLPSRARWPLTLPDFALPGLFLAAAFAETWSLFGGLMPWANVALLLIVTIVAVTRWRAFLGLLGDAIRDTRAGNLLLLVPCLAVGAANALTNGFCHDTLLYHLAAIRWVADFGSVPGLANLHGRFGFNSALHPLTALFGWPFGIEVGREYINPTIILSVCAALLQGVRMRPKEFFTPGSIYACLLFVLGFRLLFSDCFSSPQPDVAGAGLALLVAWHLREVIQELAPERQVGAFLTCLMAGALVLTFKLSYAVLGIVAAGVAIGIVFFHGRRLRLIFAGLIMVGVFSTPWLCRGYITSGYPFYPSDLGRINFDWAVPAETALVEKNWILSWGREPYQDVRLVLKDDTWFWPWVATTLGDSIFRKSALLAAAGLIIVAVSRPWLYRKDSWWRWCLLISPIILSVLFWFETAPDPRFAEGTLWILAADVAYLAFAGRENVNRFARAFLAVVIAGLLLLDSVNGFARLVKEPERFPNYVGAPVPMVSELTYSGLKVWVPAEGELAGPWTIPATPPDRFDPRLELRGQTLREGFRMNLSWPKPKWKNGRMLPADAGQ